MQFVVKGSFDENTHVLIQRAGYASHNLKGEISYTKRTGRDRYPRFHVYPEKTDDGLKINIHLDMKKHTYEGFSQHQGEYKGKTVEQEADRIKKYLESKTI